MWPKTSTVLRSSLLTLLLGVGALPFSKAIDQTYNRPSIERACVKDFRALATAQMAVTLLSSELENVENKTLNAVKQKVLKDFHWRFEKEAKKENKLKLTQVNHQTQGKVQGHSVKISNEDNEKSITYYLNKEQKILKYSLKEADKYDEAWICQKTVAQAKAQPNSKTTAVLPATNVFPLKK